MNDIHHPKQRGQCSEAAILFEFTRHGVTVLQPFGDNERYDFVVELAGEFVRVQVKTGRMENGRVQFETRSSGTLTRTVSKEGYDGQIDVFAVYAPELQESYIIPIEDAPNTSMGLRVETARKNSPNINWADEFLLRDWVGNRLEAKR
ncbi:group I intron-associated PD-(D/E)XK endonuclease [Haloferax namakaokahaiae]|uniref:Group I intron-associated PD-(D/E)XK endonuclease n=1 Tax=Haloferax namakaokahaiae TaxID=1748331 RepID=A0ABD5ZDD7_9EURY